MLVTDGATEMYDDVFEKYNWPERKVCLHAITVMMWLLWSFWENFVLHELRSMMSSEFTNNGPPKVCYANLNEFV